MNRPNKLNLGCGLDHRSGYINIDALDSVGADLVMDITDKFPFEDNSIEEIVAQDILEHLTANQQKDVFQEISRVLQMGGILKVRIPNVDEIINRFGSDTEVRNLFLYGDTSETGVWGAHKSGHTIQSFGRLVGSNGLKLTGVKEADTNFIFTFEKSKAIQIKNVLYINQTFGIGGAEAFNSDLLVWLKSQQIHITAYSTYSQYIQILKSKEIQTKKIPVSVDLLGDWKGFIKGAVLVIPAALVYLRIVWINRHTDVIMMTGFIEKILVTPWARLLNIPVIWVEFGPFESVLNKFARIPKFLYLLVRDLPYAVVVPSKNTRTHIVPYAHVSSAKVRVIPCARNIDPLVEKNKYEACCVSRLEKGKGQDILIKSWRKIVDQLPDAKVIIVGEGSEQNYLERLIIDLGLQKNVEITGWIDNALKIMAASKISVFPSIWELEGFGLVAIESMSLGKPVVGFKTGPLPEIVNDYSGILVDPGNTDELSDAIYKLLRNPSLAKKLGEAGRDKYKKSYTFDQIGPKYLQVITEAIAERRVNEILASTKPAL